MNKPFLLLLPFIGVPLVIRNCLYPSHTLHILWLTPLKRFPTLLLTVQQGKNDTVNLKVAHEFVLFKWSTRPLACPLFVGEGGREGDVLSANHKAQIDYKYFVLWPVLKFASRAQLEDTYLHLLPLALI